MKFVKLCVLLSVLISSFLLNADPPGSLQEVAGSPFAAGTNPLSIAFSPLVAGNLFAAVSNDGDNTLSVYAVDQTSGAYTPVSGSPFATGPLPTGVAFSPVISGNLYVAVSNFGDGTVSVYTVNTSTGVLNPVSGSPFASGSASTDVAFSPLVSGNLYAGVSNSMDKTVTVYHVNTTTGVFTQVSGSPFATGSHPYYLSISPEVSGNLFIATSNLIDNSVTVYKVNATTGVFAPVPGSPFATGTLPTNVAFSPLASGRLFAAISNLGDNTVSVYRVNTTTGAFTRVLGSPFTTGLGPTDVAFSPLISGNLFAGITNDSDNTVSVYTVNTTNGVFNEVSGSPFATGSEPYHIAFSPLLTGKLFAGVSNIGGNNLSVYDMVLPVLVKSFSP